LSHWLVAPGHDASEHRPGLQADAAPGADDNLTIERHTGNSADAKRVGLKSRNGGGTMKFLRNRTENLHR
jgi:hypothetical protein